MISVNSIFEELKADNSRLAKEAILRKNKDNKTLARAIELSLTPFCQFYIRKIPTYNTSVSGKQTLDWALLQLDILSKREKTGHAAIDHLTFILENVSTEDAKVIERVIAKDLKCGVSEATANKIWPGLVPSFPVMLASGYDEKLIEKTKFPAYAQLKLDGMRFCAIVQNGNVEFYSRNGKQLDIPNNLFKEPFISLSKFYGEDYVFDGELLISDSFGKPLPRTTGNGILSKSIKGTMSATEAENIRATLWDAIPLLHWKKLEYKYPYSERFTQLVSAINNVKVQNSLGHYIDAVWCTEVKNTYEAQRHFEKFLEEGLEGIILKSKDGIWEDARSKTQIKFKGELECDLVVVDWEEGTGKNKGKLGALVCESSDGIIRVNVGSGYTDEQRNNYSKSVIGKIVSVMYNARIKEKNGVTESLFLPRFVEMRLDKNKADSEKSIK